MFLQVGAWPEDCRCGWLSSCCWPVEHAGSSGRPRAWQSAGNLTGGCVGCEHEGLSPAGARRWMSATSLAELGELTALWLEGEIGQAPTNLGPPAGETAELIPVLAAVNRAGLVTDCSQPGMSEPWQGSILGCCAALPWLILCGPFRRAGT